VGIFSQFFVLLFWLFFVFFVFFVSLFVFFVSLFGLFLSIFWSIFPTLYLNSDRNTDYKTAEIMLYNPFLVKVTPISSIIRKIRPNLNIKGIFLIIFCITFLIFFPIFCIFCVTFLYFLDYFLYFSYHFLYFLYHFLDYFYPFFDQYFRLYISIRIVTRTI
jgi:hypothetical protein